MIDVATPGFEPRGPSCNRALEADAVLDGGEVTAGSRRVEIGVTCPCGATAAIEGVRALPSAVDVELRQTDAPAGRPRTRTAADRLAAPDDTEDR